jgi:phosphohistidine phosphatase
MNGKCETVRPFSRQQAILGRERSMKTIFLLRHGRAEEISEQIPDLDRPLTTQGKEQIRTLAAKIKSQELSIDLIIASPALRARQTAELFCSALGIAESRIQEDKSLYSGSANKILQLIGKLPDTKKSVLLVAHNPQLSEVASMLLKEWQQKIPVGGLLGLQFSNKAWREKIKNRAILQFFVFPLNDRKKYYHIKLEQTLLEKLNQTCESVLDHFNLTLTDSIRRQIIKSNKTLAKKILKAQKK